MKKTLALLLALTLAFSCITVLAGETSDVYEQTVVETITYDDLDANLKDKNGNAYRATDPTGNVYYKMNAVQAYLHQDDQYKDKTFELPLEDGGEYVFEYKANIRSCSASPRHAQIGAYLKYDDSTSSFPYIGFRIDARYNASNTKLVSVTPQFHFHYGERVGTTGDTVVNTPIGDAFTLTAGEDAKFCWYTFRNIYNLDTKKATLQIFDAAGTKVQEVTYDMPDKIPGTDRTISYKNMKTAYLEVSASVIYVGIDDYKITKTVAKPVTAKFDDTMVDVTYNDVTIPSGKVTAVPYNSSETATFTVSPKNGYEVDEILVNGEAIDSKTAVSFTKLQDAATFEVKMKDVRYVETQQMVTHEDKDAIPFANATTYGEYIVSEGNNQYYKAVAADATLKASYYDTTEMSNITMGSDGEYIIRYKKKFANHGGNGVQNTNVNVYYNNSGTGAQHPFMGFKIEPVDRNALNISFMIRHRPAGSDTETTVLNLPKACSFVPETWYTYEHVYNLDNKTASLLIYDETGKQIFDYTMDFPEQGVYGPFRFCYIRSNISNNAWVGIDNFQILKSTKKGIEAIYDSTMGTVTCDGAPVANGEEIVVDYNDSAASTFAVAPKEGYVIDKILVNGAEMATDTVTFKNVITDQTLEVVFKEKPAVAPTVSVAPTYSFDANYKDGAAQVAYFTVNPGYGYTFSDGIAKICEAGNNAEAMKLESAKTMSDYINNNWDGRYGIRVFGAGLEQGASYVLAPYLVAQDNNGNTVTIDPVADNDVADYTFTFGE
ncbi:MAG: hypothetical protein E7399_05040 [Ruminococcaceae bacterium]|nr:hypothetical protein [Oscillospiraceae bacterium]